MTGITVGDAVKFNMVFDRDTITILKAKDFLEYWADLKEKAEKIDSLKTHRLNLIHEITGYDNPFQGGGSIKYTIDHGDQLEKWMDELWNILDVQGEGQ